MKTITLIAVLALTGCATGHIAYQPPISPTEAFRNTVVLAKDRDAAWNAAIPRLGAQFFVINTMDKSSGLINLSYSGDPEVYVSCGQIHTDVTNIKGLQNWDFPAAAADKTFQYLRDNALFVSHRHMSLDGRINLIFEQIDVTHTRVTVNIRYVVKKEMETVMMGGSPIPQRDTATVTFNSTGSATFPGDDAPTCVPNGRLEHEILSALRE